MGLWLAVLADALRLAVLLPMTPGQERERARAVRWVFSRRDDVGGFVWCCEVLGLERGTVRAGLRRRGVRP